MKFALVTIPLITFLIAYFHFWKKAISKPVVLFYFCWLLLYGCLILSGDFTNELAEPVVNILSLLFFVVLTFLPPLMFHIIHGALNEIPYNIKNYFLPLGLLFVNMFCAMYLSIQNKNDNFLYELVENVMTYVNYITILFIFPLATIYYSFLSFRSIKLKSFKGIFRFNKKENILFMFVVLYDLYIVIWILQNYVLSNSFIKAGLKLYHLMYFVFSYLLIYTVYHLKEDTLLVEGLGFDVYEIDEKLIACLEVKKIFLNTNLTVKELAKEIDSNAKYVSYTINKIHNKNFATLINDYRIKYSQSLLKNEAYSNYTIEAIGALSGFNSKSGFNTTFKKITGQTPTQFKMS